MCEIRVARFARAVERELPCRNPAAARWPAAGGTRLPGGAAVGVHRHKQWQLGAPLGALALQAKSEAGETRVVSDERAPGSAWHRVATSDGARHARGRGPRAAAGARPRARGWKSQHRRASSRIPAGPHLRLGLARLVLIREQLAGDVAQRHVLRQRLGREEAAWGRARVGEVGRGRGASAPHRRTRPALQRARCAPAAPHHSRLQAGHRCCVLRVSAWTRQLRLHGQGGRADAGTREC